MVGIHLFNTMIFRSKSFLLTRRRMLGVIPLSALFILFDFVVHNPTHPETGTNLALLDVAAGYFSRLEYATGGSLPSSLLSDFSHIARQYVRDVQSSGRHDASTDSRSAAQVDSYNNASTELEVQSFHPSLYSHSAKELLV